MTRSTRRQFLQDVTLGSAATLAVSRSQRLAARQATDALPWKSRIGLELYTVRDRLTTDYEGTLAKIVVPEGTQDVPVNQLIAVLAEEGEDVKAAVAGAAKSVAPAAKPGSPAAKPTSLASPAPQPSLQTAAASAPGPSPATPSSLQGAEVVARSATGEEVRTDGHGANRIFSSPLARRLAKR